MTTYVTVKDILESAEKYGEDEVLTWDPTVFRDNKSINKTGGKTNSKSGKYDCTWVPFKFKFKSGLESKLLLKFSRVVTSSGAKLPSTEGDNSKNMIIIFRVMSKEELLTGDYAPKKMSNDADQIEEDLKMKNNVDILYLATEEFNKALEIIDKSYQKICTDMKNNDTLKFSVRKDKNVKDVNVYSIRQLTRENKDAPGKDIKLEFPLSRIKLLLGKTGLVGLDTWNNLTKSFDFRPNVYDSRKISAKNNFEKVLASVKDNDRMCPLDSNNASVFITYKSVAGGVIDFKEIVVSKFGLSLANNFKDLYIKRNKSNLVTSAFSKDDLEAMDVMDANNDDDEEDVVMPVAVDEIAAMENKFASIKLGKNTGAKDLENLFSGIKLGKNTEVSDLEDNIDNSDLEDNCVE